jgi:putative transposase
MSYPSDLADDQWELLEPVFNTPGKRGRKHSDDLRGVVDAMLYIAQTGMPVALPSGVVGALDAGLVTVPPLVAQRNLGAGPVGVARGHTRDGRAGRGDALDGRHRHPLGPWCLERRFTFHDRGGPYDRTKGAKRVVAADVTGLPVGALVVPASTHENRASELMLDHLVQQGFAGRPELVLVDRGVTAAAARTLGRHHNLEVRRGWDDKQPAFCPIRHAWRVEVAQGRLGRSRRLAKSFENCTSSPAGSGSPASRRPCATPHASGLSDAEPCSPRDRLATIPPRGMRGRSGLSRSSTFAE